MLLNPFRPYEGSPTYQEEYRGSYVPKAIDTWRGPQIVAPDTSYVAAAGKNHLYFIDTRFDAETARHVKEQIERALVVKADDYIAINEFLATVEVRNSVTGETTFMFDPAYARVLFAKGINKRNLSLNCLNLSLLVIGWWPTASALKIMAVAVVQTANGRQVASVGTATAMRLVVDNECERGLHNGIGGC